MKYKNYLYRIIKMRFRLILTMTSVLRKMKRVIIFMFLLIPRLMIAQYDLSYVPMETYDANSDELIRYIKSNLNYGLKKSRASKIELAYEKSTDRILNLVNKKVFIRDDSLQAYVEDVINDIVSSNSINNKPKLILIAKNPSVNAFNMGQGVILVNIGLLGKVWNRSQLAFVLAHEIAHEELKHVTIKSVHTGSTAKTRQQLNQNLRAGTITAEGLALLRNISYEGSSLSQAIEVMADSKGFEYYTNAGYPPEQAIAALEVITKAYRPKYPLGELLLAPFHSKRFPIKAHWIRNRPKAYSNPTRSLIFNTDSLRSHPKFEERKANIESHFNNDRVKLNANPEKGSRLISMAEFEAIEAAYFTRQYDHCIHLALQMKSRYPGNSYTVTMISKVLIELVEARLIGTFGLYVPQFTSYYHEELRQLNNFLYNLSDTELGNAAYFFLSKSANFNRQNEDHVYLLWKIAKLTNRADVRKRMKDVYRNKFPKGKYNKEIR